MRGAGRRPPEGPSYIAHGRPADSSCGGFPVTAAPREGASGRPMAYPPRYTRFGRTCAPEAPMAARSRLLACVAAAALALAAPGGARAADPAPAAGKDRPRIGVLFWHDSPNDREALAGVRDGFALSGLDPIFEVVEARGDDAAAKAALADFQARKVDLVYALGTGAALRAKAAIREIPVVFTAVTDPLGSGLVDSLAGSGGNLCGNASGIDPAAALATFRAALPRLATLAVVHDPDNPVSRSEVAALGRAGLALDPPLRLEVTAVKAALL